jgi:hypothetical protein
MRDHEGAQLRVDAGHHRVLFLTLSDWARQTRWHFRCTGEDPTRPHHVILDLLLDDLQPADDTGLEDPVPRPHRVAFEEPQQAVGPRLGRTVRFESEALERWLRAHGRRKAGSGGSQVAVNAAEGA